MSKIVLKNLGYEATPIDGVAGYEHVVATLCAECAQDTTIDGIPFPGYDDGDGKPFPVYARFDWPEVDNPIHCDDCGAMLPCSLTTDGQEYVKEYCRTHRNKTAKLYREFFDTLFAR